MVCCFGCPCNRPLIVYYERKLFNGNLVNCSVDDK